MNCPICQSELVVKEWTGNWKRIPVYSCPNNSERCHKFFFTDEKTFRLTMYYSERQIYSVRRYVDKCYLTKINKGSIFHSRKEVELFTVDTALKVLERYKKLEVFS